MLYAGFLYTNAYYGYFRVGVLGLDLASFELALRSLRLITLPVLAIAAAVFLLPRILHSLVVARLSVQGVERLRRCRRLFIRFYPAYIGIGVILVTLWRYIQPFGWVAPVFIAGGLLLGQSQEAASFERRRRKPAERALSVVVAGAFLMWVVALTAGRLGDADARRSADRLEGRTAVVVLSAERLSLVGPGVRAEDLQANVPYRVQFRYRYTGLRLLIGRGDRYYLLPVGWRRDLDATYVLRDGEKLRIELRPGTRTD